MKKNHLITLAATLLNLPSQGTEAYFVDLDFQDSKPGKTFGVSYNVITNPTIAHEFACGKVREEEVGVHASRYVRLWEGLSSDFAHNNLERYAIAHDVVMNGPLMGTFGTVATIKDSNVFTRIRGHSEGPLPGHGIEYRPCSVADCVDNYTIFMESNDLNPSNVDLGVYLQLISKQKGASQLPGVYGSTLRDLYFE